MRTNIIILPQVQSDDKNYYSIAKKYPESFARPSIHSFKCFFLLSSGLDMQNHLEEKELVPKNRLYKRFTTILQKS